MAESALVRFARNTFLGEQRSFFPWDDFATFNYGNLQYPLTVPPQSLGGHEERPAQSFMGYVQALYKSNGVVYAVMAVRMLLFSEARFQWRRMQSGRPGDLFGTPELQILENPWPGATTGDLLTRMIQDADLEGNFYCTIRGGQIRRLNPAWVTIVVGSPNDPSIEAWDIDSELVGYIYHPNGPHSGIDPEVLLPEEVCHFKPIPDPAFHFRGMSWLTPVVREILADGAATSHKLKFFESGATPNMVVSLDPAITKDQFDQWIETFKGRHEGVRNAYRTLYLGGGAKVDVVGSNFQQIDFKITQGAGETRIAAAGGVPPVVVGLSEGLQAATYSNYELAMRRLTDLTMRPLWRNAAGSLQNILRGPGGGAELWYDDRDIPALAEAETDRAMNQSTRAQTLHTLIAAGFKPDTAILAVEADDFSLLDHTDLFSVQLQPAGSVTQGKGALVAGTVTGGNGTPAAPEANGTPP